jgi:hypothetical protein
MNDHRRCVIRLGVALVLVAVLGGWLILERISSGIVASVEHKSAKRATGTVVSVTRLLPKVSSKQGGDIQELYQVCFTINDFSQVEPDMREGYESAEAQRLARDGPRCTTTHKAALATHLSKGDKLWIEYLLENQYQIDFVGITTYGEEL